jgi:hypothetical protein
LPSSRRLVAFRINLSSERKDLDYT